MIKPLVQFIENNQNIKAIDIVNILKKYKLEMLLPIILKRMEKTEKINKSKNKLIIKSPFDMSDEVISKIEKMFDVNESKRIKDAKVLGGFKAYNSSKLLDLSIESVIKKIKL